MPLLVVVVELMQIFALDYLRLFTLTSNSRFKYILVGVKYINRYLIALPTKEAKVIIS